MTKPEAIEKLAAFADKTSKAELARKLGCSRSFAWLLLNDKRNAGRKVALNASKCFQIPVSVWNDGE